MTACDNCDKVIRGSGFTIEDADVSAQDYEGNEIEIYPVVLPQNKSRQHACSEKCLLAIVKKSLKDFKQ